MKYKWYFSSSLRHWYIFRYYNEPESKIYTLLDLIRLQSKKLVCLCKSPQDKDSEKPMWVIIPLLYFIDCFL
uniref:Uncharacterized protein n=1 Tax=Kuenenia stuttgartiensis TaxID=174633 RepID=Q1Q0V7_KUEST|nr:unknown protein [Candidatus Kuenenia stuttgartiensis]